MIKGSKHSVESCRKMSEALKGRKGWNKGVPHSEEHKRKIQEAHLRRMSPEERRLKEERRREWRRDYSKKYYRKFREIRLKKAKEWHDKHKEETREYKRRYQEKRKEWLKENPWYKHYQYAKHRCSFWKCPYCKKGIKMLMTPEEVRFIWERDKAYLLKHPSIDRIDSEGHYTLENARFINRWENCRQGLVGRVYSPETKRKMSISAKRRCKLT